MNYTKQKTQLARAVKTESSAAIALVCAKTVAEWDGQDGYWPDDWNRWQRALDDALRVHVPIENLRIENGKVVVV